MFFAVNHQASNYNYTKCKKEAKSTDRDKKGYAYGDVKIESCLARALVSQEILTRRLLNLTENSKRQGKK